ncbi:MAG: hypothetical protein PHU98_06435, partial [Mariniphaga sp.]|nr:hypothetical protein [Mariniphaga sp.]
MPKPKLTLKQLTKLYNKKPEFINDYLTKFGKDLKGLQKELLTVMLSDYLTNFQTQDGNVIFNEYNARQINGLNKIFSDFQAQFSDEFFKETGNKMLELTGMTSEYFRELGYKKTTLSGIEKALEKYRITIGIDKKGEIIEGSFISNLTKSEPVREELADFLRKGIEGERKYKDIVKGFKDIIVGTPESNGAHERYIGGYVHDSFFAHGRAIDNFFAQELGLTHFIYAGDVIEKTRPFCEERAGNVYSIDELEEWNDLDWAGKIEGEDVATQLGGLYC